MIFFQILILKTEWEAGVFFQINFRLPFGKASGNVPAASDGEREDSDREHAYGHGQSQGVRLQGQVSKSRLIEKDTRTPGHQLEKRHHPF